MLNAVLSVALHSVLPRHLLVQIPDILRVFSNYAIRNFVFPGILFIFLTDIQNICPLFRIVFNISPAFPGKRQDALPMIIDPQICHLFLQAF